MNAFLRARTAFGFENLISFRAEHSDAKHFDSNKFLRDLNQMPWDNVDLYSDPNDM